MKIAALFCIFGIAVGSPWNDADETRRINQIKHDEQRAFEMQMRGQNPFVGGSSRPLESSPFQSGLYSNYPHQSVNPVGAPVHRVQIESRPGHTAELRSEPPRIEEKRTKNWCFHCSSAWHSVGEDLQMALKNLLDMRRARFPSTSYTRSDCSAPKNVSDLPKQDCGLSYCQTLFITDHNQGSTLTIRGCAEKYGAVDERELENRGDNVCKKLHPTVDIQECICKNRKFCYAGAERNFGYKEDDEASFFRRSPSFDAGHFQVVRNACLVAVCSLFLIWTIN